MLMTTVEVFMMICFQVDVQARKYEVLIVIMNLLSEFSSFIQQKGESHSI